MTLDHNAYLTHQLYTASKSPRVRKSRLQSWILLTITFLLMGFVFSRIDNNALATYFFVLAAITAVLYPFYSRGRYKRHYRKYIEDGYKNRFNEECSLTFTDEFIYATDRTGEVKVKLSEVEQINEIKDFYFIRLKTAASFIIPKKTTAPDELAKIKDGLSRLVGMGVPHNVELDWKWR